MTHDAHGHGGGAAHAAHGPEGGSDRMVLSDGPDAPDSGSWKDEKSPHERDAGHQAADA